MANYSQMKDEILDFFDQRYSNVLGFYNANGFRYKHVEIRTIYAFLAGRFPDSRMEDCFHVVQDVLSFCSSPESVYPYPDGEYWTAEELVRYLTWRDRIELPNQMIQEGIENNGPNKTEIMPPVGFISENEQEWTDSRGTKYIRKKENGELGEWEAWGE